MYKTQNDRQQNLTVTHFAPLGLFHQIVQCHSVHMQDRNPEDHHPRFQRSSQVRAMTLWTLKTWRKSSAGSLHQSLPQEMYLPLKRAHTVQIGTGQIGDVGIDEGDVRKRLRNTNEG